jgi:hypothetical protein
VGGYLNILRVSGKSGTLVKWPTFQKENGNGDQTKKFLQHGWMTEKLSVNNLMQEARANSSHMINIFLFAGH